MKHYETSSCGRDLRFLGPETSVEYNELAAPRTGDPCCEDAVQETLNSRTILAWQAAFAKQLEEISGVKRPIDDKRTAIAKGKAKNPENVQDVPIKFRAYHELLMKQFAGNDEMLASFAAASVAVQDSITINPAPAARGAGIKKEYLAKADSILDEEDEVIETKVAKLLGGVGDFTLVRDEHDRPERESLARLIAAWVEAL